VLNRLIVLPKNLTGLKPVLILPLLGTLLTGVLMVYAVGTPVAAALAFLTEWLRSMQGSSAVLLGVILGAMMAFDVGGPVNKAAYAFSVALISSQVYTPMAAVMAAGMSPPLGIALATRLFANRFTPEEREAGSAAAVLGLAFVSEGRSLLPRAILSCHPFADDRFGHGGRDCHGLGVELRVPHGGIFVLPIPGAVTHPAGYALALAAGTVVSAVLVGLLKRPGQGLISNTIKDGFGSIFMTVNKGLAALVAAGMVGCIPAAQAGYAPQGPVAGRAVLADKGITLSLSYTGEAAANLNGGCAQGAYSGQVYVGADADMGKIAGLTAARCIWPSPTATAKLSSIALGNNTSVQEIWGTQNTHLAILTWEQKLFHGAGHRGGQEPGQHPFPDLAALLQLPVELHLRQSDDGVQGQQLHLFPGLQLDGQGQGDGCARLVRPCRHL
jgi:hypothetical protein